MATRNRVNRSTRGAKTPTAPDIEALDREGLVALWPVLMGCAVRAGDEFGIVAAVPGV